MERKKWTPKTNVDDALIHFREKRKWQIALRRYVLERNKSSYYAPFFGLDIEKFREWVARQFNDTLNWNNFSEAWQLDHIVPVAYFDFSNNADMKLCWNFTNIRVEKTVHDKNRNGRIDVLAAKAYFQWLFERTGYAICREMMEKIGKIETSQIAANAGMDTFLTEHKTYLDNLLTFSSYEFEKLNEGILYEKVLFEVNFLKKFSRGEK